MTDAASIGGTLGLGPIDQVSYAVRNLDEALPRYAALFGPFRTMSVKLDGLAMRGREVKAELNLGFGRSGDLEVELVEVVSGDFPQTEFLRRHGEGLHHVRFLVEDVPAKIEELTREGYQLVLTGLGGQVLFAYLEAPDFLGGSLIELLRKPAS